MPRRLIQPLRGVGLIEVMIALVLFSSATIALANTQIIAKRNLLEASQRAYATSLARDLHERMGANTTALGEYLAADLSADDGISIHFEGRSCRTNDCAPSEVAANDMHDWRVLLHKGIARAQQGGGSHYMGGLPGASACLSNNNGVVTLTLVWENAATVYSPAVGECSPKDPYSPLFSRLTMVSFVDSGERG